MEEHKKDKIEDVMNSMKGIRQVSPPDDLFEQINNRIEAEKDEDKFIFQWSYVAAAAVFLIFINVFSVVYYQKMTSTFAEQKSVNEIYGQGFTNDFQIYN